VGENLTVGPIFEEFLEEEGKINTMDGRKRLKLSRSRGFYEVQA
jgi:hypothetical protein